MAAFLSLLLWWVALLWWIALLRRVALLAISAGRPIPATRGSWRRRVTTGEVPGPLAGLLVDKVVAAGLVVKLSYPWEREVLRRRWWAGRWSIHCVFENVD
jgi:hypothetical protein